MVTQLVDEVIAGLRALVGVAPVLVDPSILAARSVDPRPIVLVQRVIRPESPPPGSVVVRAYAVATAGVPA